MGVHFTLGNGQPGGLLGNLPYDQRLAAAHAGDANADWPNSAPDGFNQAQADLSLLGPNYGDNSTPVSDEFWDQMDQQNLKAMQDYLSQGVGYTVPIETARQALTSSWANSGFGGYDVRGADTRSQTPSAVPQTFTNPQALFSAPTAPGTTDAPAAPANQVQQASGTGTAARTTSSATPTSGGTNPVNPANTQASMPSTATFHPYSTTTGAGGGIPGYVGIYGNTSPGSISGTPGHAGAGAYGTVPNVPDPVLSGNQAIAGNIANLGGIFDLAGGVNDFQTEQLLKQYSAGLPDYQALTQKASANIANELAGVVPPDVINQISQAAAERGVASGSYMDPNSNAAYLKALGLTSLGLQQQGQSDLTAAVKRTPTAGLFNPQTMFVSPEQEQAAQMAANLYAAAPDPAQAAAEAERKALEGLKAGQGAAGGGGSTIAAPTIAPAGVFNPTGGSSFNPLSGGGGGSVVNPFGSSIPVGGLGGGTNLGGLQGYDWSNLGGTDSLGSYVDTTTGNTITGSGVDVPYAGGYDPTLAYQNQFNYDSSFLDDLGLSDSYADEEDWASLFGG